MNWPEITEETPIEEVKRIHQMIWDYVIENGEKPDTPYTINCVACARTRIDSKYKFEAVCDLCPIVWPGDALYPYCVSPRENGLYDRFCNAYGAEKIELAKQIRDLPWKFEIEKNTTL